MSKFALSSIRNVTLVVVLQCACLANAATIHVTTNGVDTADGASWKTAKLTVTAALNVSTNGDEVWVAAGTYREQITLKDGVALYGGFAGTETQRSQRDWNANVSALDSPVDGDVVTAPPGIAQPTCIDGFAIRNNNATRGSGVYCSNASPTIANNTITGHQGYQGGGINCVGGSPKICDNVISANQAGVGGGLSIQAADSPLVLANTITGNLAASGGSTYEGGGGIRIVGGSATLEGNTICGNEAAYLGGGVSCAVTSVTLLGNVIKDNVAGSNGGGVSCDTATVSLLENTFQGNSGTWGGAVRIYDSTAVIALNNIVENESSQSGGAISSNSSDGVVTSNVIRGNTAQYGGGIYLLYSSDLVLSNNEIAGNRAEEGGGGIQCIDSSCRISNNTLVGNAAAYGGGVLVESTVRIQLQNNVIAFNSSGLYALLSPNRLYNNAVFGNPGGDFQIMADPTGVNGNVSADPRFRIAKPGPDDEWGTEDDVLEDLRLSAGSPCIDAGTNGLVPADIADLDDDGDTTEPLPFDLDGAARFVDAPAAPDTGAGAPPIVDIGAYEFAPGDGDFDYDGNLDLADYGFLTDCLRGPVNGLPVTECYIADFDGDGNVDLEDAADFTAAFTNPTEN